MSTNSQPSSRHNTPPPSTVVHSSDPKTEYSSVLKALSVVYSSTSSSTSSSSITSSASSPSLNDPSYDLSNRSSADAFLVSFQHSATSWMVCDLILSSTIPTLTSPSSNPYSSSASFSFFAATTLHTKTCDDIHQLPVTQLPLLRDSIIQHLLSLASSSPSSPPSSKPLISRLCMALSCLFIHLSQTSSIQDLINPQSYLSTQLSPSILLTLLKSLPEEAGRDGRMRVQDENDRHAFNRHLSDAAPSVLEFLSSSAKENSTNQAVQELILSTLIIWIRYVQMDPRSLATTSIVFDYVFTKAITSPPLQDQAADVVVEILREYESVASHQDNSPVVSKMIPSIMSLVPAFNEAKASENEDDIKLYVRIFTEMGEAYMSLLFDTRELGQISLVELVLNCTRVADPEIACMTMNFWYRFVDWIENLHPYEYRQIKIDYYVEVLNQLVDVCCVIMQYPDTVFTASEEEMEDLKKNRHFVADTMDDCCRLLGGNTVLVQICSRLQKVCSVFTSLSPAQQANAWQPIEACLFATRSIGGCIPSDEKHVIPHVMNLIPQLPKIPLLRQTCSLLLGRYAEWLANHPSYIEAFFGYLVDGFLDKSSSLQSATSIKHLCGACGAMMNDPVLQLYDQLTASNCEVAEMLEVLEGLCKVMAKLDYEQATQTLSRIMQPIGKEFDVVLAPNYNATPKQVNAVIDKITTLVQHLVVKNGPNQPSLAFSLFNQVFPTLSQIVQRWGADPNLAEKISKCYKHALRNCKLQFAPLLEPLIQQLLQMFEHSFCSSYLYASSICITEFGLSAECVPKLFHMITILSQSVFKRLQTHEAFTNHPDVVEEYFYLIGRFISYCPEPLIKSELIKHILQCSCVGMHVQHTGAQKGVLSFIESTLNHGLKMVERKEETADFECAIVETGELLVGSICKGLMCEVTVFFIEGGSGSFAGILYKLYLLCAVLAKQWVETSLGKNVVVEMDAGKSQFLQIFGAQSMGKEEFERKVRQFHDGCWRVINQVESRGA